MHTTDEIPLSTTAERQIIAAEAGTAPDKDWVIVTRGLKRDYDMGGEVVHALRGVDIAIRRMFAPFPCGKSAALRPGRDG